MLRPGSLGWLLRWELRLAWRGYAARFSRGRSIGAVRMGVNLLLMGMLLHGMGGSFVYLARAAHPGPPMQLLALATDLGTDEVALVGLQAFGHL